MSLQAVQHEDAVARSLRAQLEEVHAAPQRAAQPNFYWQGHNDVAMTVNGDFKTEYVRQHEANAYNKDVIDEYSFFADRIDLDTNIAYGEGKYGKPAIQVHHKARHKHKGGAPAVMATDSSSFRIGEVRQEVEPAKISHPLQWVKHLWAEASVNALTGRNAATDHTIRFGMFDHSVGRGIAYGPLFGTNKKFLGVFNASSDFSPFGVRLSGDLVKDRLSYNLYFARLQEMSGSFQQVQERNKAHINAANPQNGKGKANDVLSASVKVNYGNHSLGDMTSDLYVVWNKASDQHVEMDRDSKVSLATGGWGLEYSKGNFEFGYEAAVNFGEQHVFAIDRNTMGLAVIEDVVTGLEADAPAAVTTETQVIAPVYSKVTVAGGTGVITSNGANNVKTEVEAYTGDVNSAVLTGTATIGGASRALANASDRFRKEYRNTFAGWMVVADMSYDWKKAGVKLHAGAGHASGDNNPHLQETNKTYHGFIGMHENYAGKRVKSVFMLNARKGFRPHIQRDDSGNTAVLIDNSFTDMTFVGAGFDWKLAKRNIDVNCNVLGFFKDKASLKYDSVADQSINENARKYLGTEANVNFTWNLLPGLDLAGQFAAFLPGSFYEDTKGTPLNTKFIAHVDKADTSGRTQAKPRTGTDTAYHLNLGLQYKF